MHVEQHPRMTISIHDSFCKKYKIGEWLFVARNFMDYLMSNKKIAQATHNISAYRIKLQNGGILQVNKTYSSCFHEFIVKFNRIVTMMAKRMLVEDYYISYKLLMSLMLPWL